MSKKHTRANSESLVSRYECSCLTRPFGIAKHEGKIKHKAAVSRTLSPCISKTWKILRDPTRIALVKLTKESECLLSTLVSYFGSLNIYRHFLTVNNFDRVQA